MANTIKVSVLADVKDINSKLGKVNDQLGGFGKATKRIGGLIAGAFAGTAAVGAVKKLVTSASDLNETISKTQTIFGKSSPAIMKWSKEAAANLGLSQQSALDGVSTFGNFFNQIGIGAKQTEKMSKGFVQAAVDLGSFHNAAPTDVMDALAAATRGEYDSLQKYIPTINAARVEQEALRATGKKSAKELTAQDKARAVSALVMKGQGKAAGDFARTQGSLANQTKILKAKFDNLTAQIGAKLLPIAVKVATFMNSNLGPALGAVGTFIKTEVVPAISSLVRFFKEYQNIILPIAGGILAMVAAYKIYATTAKAIQAVQKAWTAVQVALNVAMTANPIGLIVLALVGLAAAFVIAYKKSETFRNIVNGAWEAIKTVTVTVFNFVKNIIVQIWTDIKATVTGAVHGVKNVVTSVWNAIRTATSAVWNGVKAAVTVVLSIIRAVIGSYFNAYKTVISAAWNAVKAGTSAVWNGLKNIVGNAIGNIMDKVHGIKSKVTGAFAGAAGWLLNAGKNIIGGLLNGIESMIGFVKSKLKALTNLIPKLKGPEAKDKMLLRKNGRLIIKGLVDGFKDNEFLVRKQLSGLTNRIGDNYGMGVLSPSTGLSAGGAGNTYAITVNVPVNANPVATGKAITDAIKAYERAGGR